MSFKLICICGNEVELKDRTSNKDYEDKASFLPIQSSSVNVCCKECDNEVYIDI